MNFKRVLLAVLPLILTACEAPQTNSPRATTTISIGIAVAQTSNIALVGQEQIAGAKIAESYFNKQGGINGTPIKLVFQDSGKDEAGAINAFQALITKNSVIGIIGPTSSQQAFSAAPIADRAKVPVIGPSNIAKGIPEIGDYVARISASADIVAPKVVEATLKLYPKIKKVAALYAQDQDALVYESKVFQQAVAKHKLDLVTVQKFQITDTDFQTQATKVISLNPELVIISGLVADGGNLVKQLRELGYKGLIIGGNGFNSSNIFSVCKALCDGVLVAQAYSSEYKSNINTAFRSAYINEYKKEPPQFSAQAFTAVQVFVEALKAVNKKSNINSLSIKKLRDEVNQQILAGKYDTPLGAIAFTPTGDVIQKEFFVAKIKMDAEGNNGRFIFLK